MKKPTKPKKPRFPLLQAPECEEQKLYYPRNKYDFRTNKTTLVYLAENEFPEDDDSQKMHDFYDEYGSVEELTLQQLVDFAKSKNLQLDQIEVSAIIPPGDPDYTEMELRITRKRDDAEYQQLLDAYKKQKAKQEARLADYERQKVEYKRAKAQYDLHVAQQKLAELET